MNEQQHHSRRPRTERLHRQRHRQHREQQRMWHACQDLCNAYHGAVADRDRHRPVHHGADGVGDFPGEALAGIPEQAVGSSRNVDGG
jgi:hypothetical protein